MNAAPGTVGLRQIVAGAFGVLRARPVAVLVWALIYGVATTAVTLAVRSGLRFQPEPGGNPNALPPMGASLLFNLGFIILYMVLLTAAMRSALKPSERGIAYLRLGMDELRQIGLCLFFLILFYVGLIIIGIVVAVIAGLVIAAAGTGTAMILAIAIGIAVLVVPTCWLSVRLSLSFPLTLLRGAITISESWRLTRGRFWTLFGGYLLIYLVLLVFSLGVASVTMADYLAEIARGGITLQSVQAATRAQLARQLGPIDAMMILGWVLAGLAGGIGIALQGGSLATAARELADVRAEMAETFS
jgi:hypothetical protein